MLILLDTHTFLWAIHNSSRLSSTAVAVITDPANRLRLSAASHWEMAIKSNQGKLTLARPFDVFISDEMKKLGVSTLRIEWERLVEAERLPQHHRNTFDRMIIAQAIVEQMPVVSADADLDLYPVQRVW